jgi:TatD DNase family protein
MLYYRLSVFMSNISFLTDSHCHLEICAQQTTDSQERLKRFVEGGGMVLDIGIEQGDEHRRRGFWMPGVRWSLGIHPNQSLHDLDPDWDKLKQGLLLGASAVGETGLDYFRAPQQAKRQKEWFARHLEIAHELDLPVVIHCRQALGDVLDVLKGFPGVRGVMHCFSEDWEAACRCLELGMMVSFAGNVTYPKNHTLHEVAQKVPSDQWLVETDAPFLAPQPVRHLKNHPDLVHHTLEFVAKMRGLTLDEALQESRTNFLNLFNRCAE